MANPLWKVFSLPDLLATKSEISPPYYEFLRAPSLSCGIYTLAAGAKDLQSPHDEDEVYHVLEGRGRVRVEGAEREVGPGSILYVQAQGSRIRELSYSWEANSYRTVDASMSLNPFSSPSSAPSSASPRAGCCC